MGMKELVSSAQQRTCTSVVVGQKVICQAQHDGFETSAIFPCPAYSRLFPASANKEFSESTIR
jgi:hypothetical protein